MAKVKAAKLASRFSSAKTEEIPTGNKVWIQKDVCNGYIVGVKGEDGSIVETHSFVEMWPAIDFFRS